MEATSLGEAQVLLPPTHLLSPSTRPLGKGLTALGVQFWLDWLVSRSLLPPGPGLQTPSHGLAFAWVLGIQTQVLVLA